jgi:type III pantothenate kinase
MVKALSQDIRNEAFGGDPAVVIGTGGFSRLFEQEHIFDRLLPDLILIGLERALSLNEGASRPWNGSPGEIAP